MYVYSLSQESLTVSTFWEGLLPACLSPSGTQADRQLTAVDILPPLLRQAGTKAKQQAANYNSVSMPMISQEHTQATPLPACLLHLALLTCLPAWEELLNRANFIPPCPAPNNEKEHEH